MTGHGASRSFMVITALLVSVATLLVFAVLGYAIYRGKTERNLLCKAQNNSNAGTRLILQLAQERSPDTAESRLFYHDAYALIPPIAC